jgi:transcriptional regulator with XRE-family HTH domain
MATGETERHDLRQDEEQSRIAAAVKLLLLQSGVSQGDLASYLKVTRSSLNRSMNVDGSRPRKWQTREIKEMALFFDVPFAFFFDDVIETEYEEVRARVDREYDAAVARVRKRMANKERHA